MFCEDVIQISSHKQENKSGQVKEKLINKIELLALLLTLFLTTSELLACKRRKVNTTDFNSPDSLSTF